MAWYNRIPLVGGFFDNPEQEALTAQFQNMANAYEQYRHYNADLSGERMQQQMSATGPMQQYLSGMLPDLQPFNTQQMVDNFKGLTNNRGPGIVGAAAGQVAGLPQTVGTTGVPRKL